MSRTGKFFIVMRIDLATDPTVAMMAAEIKQRPEVIVGYLHSVWGWFASHTESGIAHGVSIEALEGSTHLHDFPQLMEKHGWLKEWKDDHGRPSLEIPNWERWFGGAEQRKQYERERKKSQRVSKTAEKQDVPDNVPDNSGTSAGHFAPTGTETGTTYEVSGASEALASDAPSEHSAKPPPPPASEATASAAPKPKRKRAAYTPEFLRMWNIIGVHATDKARTFKAWSQALGDPALTEKFSKTGQAEGFITEKLRLWCISTDANPLDRSPMKVYRWLDNGRYDDNPDSWQRVVVHDTTARNFEAAQRFLDGDGR